MKPIIEKSSKNAHSIDETLKTAVVQEGTTKEMREVCEDMRALLNKAHSLGVTVWFAVAHDDKEIGGAMLCGRTPISTDRASSFYVKAAEALLGMAMTELADAAGPDEFDKVLSKCRRETIEAKLRSLAAAIVELKTEDNKDDAVDALAMAILDGTIFNPDKD